MSVLCASVPHYSACLFEKHFARCCLLFKVCYTLTQGLFSYSISTLLLLIKVYKLSFSSQ